MNPRRETVLEASRRAVRGLLEANPELGRLPADTRRRLASRMVEVTMLAADQMAADEALTAAAAAPRRSPPLAAAQAANARPNLSATREAAPTIEALQKAIDFPRFVTNLISGVFQAITTSSIQQLEAVASLLDTVSASGDEFATSNITPAAAVSWAVGRFSFLRGEMSGTEPTLVVRDGASVSDNAAAVQRALDATEAEVSAIDDSDLTETLLPLVRRKMGRDRQALLATMVQMGMQRIVVDQGQMHASMDMRVDTRSVAEQAQRDSLDARVSASASANVGVGAWGASATMSTSVAVVKDDQSTSREEIASQAGLRSSVDLVFHTEPLAMDMMASERQRTAVLAHARVPTTTWNTGNSLTSPQTSLPPIAAPTPAVLPPPAVAPTPPGARPAAPAPRTPATPAPATPTPATPAPATPAPARPATPAITR